MNNRIYRLLVIIVATVTIIGALICLYVLDANSSVETGTEIILDGETQKTMAVQLSDMNPGSKKEYTVKTALVSGDTYNMKIGFKSTGAGHLAKYITVEVRRGGVVIASGWLSDFLGGKTVEYTFDTSAGNTSAFELIYLMDADAGNEAQGTSASFEVTLLITRK